MVPDGFCRVFTSLLFCPLQRSPVLKAEAERHSVSLHKCRVSQYRSTNGAQVPVSCPMQRGGSPLVLHVYVAEVFMCNQRCWRRQASRSCCPIYPPHSHP